MKTNHRHLLRCCFALGVVACSADPSSTSTVDQGTSSTDTGPSSTNVTPSGPPPVTSAQPTSTGQPPTNGTPAPTATGEVTDSGETLASTSAEPPSIDPSPTPTNATTGSADETSSQSASPGTSNASDADSESTSGDTDPATTCDESPPPPEVAAWVQESWDAQLGDNIANRQAWLLDNVMKGEGQINLCVRWGATSAPSAAVKAELASSVQAWFNDWFNVLGDYGCFPYGDGITAKVTGWAVRPGNESWVDDLGPEVAVYTETDAEGEPKCPDACSFFEHWDHSFPNCPGGEAFHTDYWIWVDDALPGGGGAAAVGGDWGLRMPASALVASLGRTGDNIIEHEMGHGFGFQDYYDWTGSTPEGGSLMIVGSQRQGLPTVGDTWLLRRTWLESKALRGW